MVSLIHRLADAAAERHSEGPAACLAQDVCTWQEVSSRSDQLACVLQEEGVGRGDRVAVLFDKDLRVPTALYGVMKAGAAYVPLDPRTPPARQRAILLDCGARWLVTQPELYSMLEPLTDVLECVIGVRQDLDGVRTVSWDDVAQTAAPTGLARVLESDLAYIIYTSGSTGLPKGIMHSHRSGVVYAQWAVRTYALDRQDRLANHAPLHFDMSTFDWFVAAAAAAATVIVPEPHLKLPASHSQLLQDQRVSVIFTVPTVLTQLLLRGVLEARDLSALRWVVFGGEVSTSRHIRRLMELWPHAKFSNMYGPAETNGCTSYDLTAPPVGDEPIPIGSAFEHMETLVVGENGERIGPGGSGELLVRGATKMLGYWGRPDLTAQASYSRALGPGLEEAFYRTGDMVAVLADSNLRFLGRKDRQVKVRGNRVELEEIETALCGHRAVAQAAAYVVDREDGSTFIKAAILPEPGASPAIEAILDLARQKLPPYAVPVGLEVVTSMPRTSTGKIDRRRVESEAR